MLVTSALCVGSGRARDKWWSDRWGCGRLGLGVGVCTVHRLDICN